MKSYCDILLIATALVAVWFLVELSLAVGSLAVLLGTIVVVPAGVLAVGMLALWMR